MPIRQRHCIFCGGPGRLTYEHIFADWLKPYIPRTKREHRASTTLIDGDKTEQRSEIRLGDPHSQQLRIVCNRCNSGWMSGLQDRAKPHLVPLLTNQRHVLDPFYARTVAGWLAMSMAVGQFNDSSYISVTREELDHIRLHREPPPGWKLWIGCGALSRFASFAYSPFSVVKGVPPKNSRMKEPNSHATVMRFGKHFFGHALASRGAPGVVLQWEYPPLLRQSIRRVWPPIDESIEWPPDNALTDTGLFALYRYFTHRAHLAHRDVVDN